MNLVAVAPAWLLILFGCAMLAAAVEDARKLRISNLTSLIVLAGAILSAILAGPTWSLWQNVVMFLVILVLGTIAFSWGWLGGGDVKLFAAAGLWFDFAAGLWFVAFVFIAGGVVAIAYLLALRFRRRVHEGRKKMALPYGIAIALGAAGMVLVNVPKANNNARSLPPIRIAPHP